MADFKVGDRVRVLSGGDGVVTYGPVNSTFDSYTMFVVKQDGDEERAFKVSDLEPFPVLTVGDRARLTYADVTVTVKAGPFQSWASGDEFWIVEYPDGRHATPVTSSLTPLPAADPVKVGDTVRVVVDDPNIYEGAFVGLVGTVEDTESYRGQDRAKVRFGDGTGDHGDKANGYWWCDKVEKVNVHVHNGVTYDLTAKYHDKDGDVWRFEDIDGTVRGEIDGRKVGMLSLSLAYAVREYGPLTKI
ncbi:phiSA1p31-related protein [Streptomyces niveus]|uniref:phiSA1p31-related protein n=1 Tax=Streptomyces niveus TaxID=193462 RepID=UPI00386618D0